MTIYDFYKIDTMEVPCDRRDAYGIERVFVIARNGAEVLLFDDVDDEFAIVVPNSDGILRKWGLCGSLLDALRLLANITAVE